ALSPPGGAPAVALCRSALARPPEALRLGRLRRGIGRAYADFPVAAGQPRRDRQLRLREDPGVRDAQIPHVERVADLEGRHIELDPVGDVLGQHLDLHLTGHLVEHAAGVAYAVGIAHQVHRHFELDLLGRVDLVELHVDDVGPDRVALDLAVPALGGRAGRRWHLARA